MGKQGAEFPAGSGAGLSEGTGPQPLFREWWYDTGAKAIASLDGWPRLALLMLAAGRPDNAVGWLLVCREVGLLAGEIGRVHRGRGELARADEIESDLQHELDQIRGRIDTALGPAVLDAETEAARRARDLIGPATRVAAEQPADGNDVDAVKRLIDPTRRRRPRQRSPTARPAREGVPRTPTPPPSPRASGA